VNTFISQTQNWLDQFIIKHNICPFAQKEREKNSIRFVEDAEVNIEQLLENLIKECEYLDENSNTETTLIIFSSGLIDYDDYLDFVGMAERLLISLDYEGIYQLASFHPDYCFADSDENDAANYTNRSPYPMLHIIREKSLQIALDSFPNPEQIPERNINYCRDLGLNYVQQLLTGISTSKP